METRVVTRKEKMLDEEYYYSKRWACEKSPTGAHHWHNIIKEVWQCCYCESFRLFPLVYDECEGKKNDVRYKAVVSKERIGLVIEMLEGRIT